MKSNLCNPCLFHRKKGHRFPDAGVRQPRSPVPAEHIMPFTDLRKSPHGILRPTDRGVGFILRSDISDRRMNGHDQLILRRSHEMSDRKLPGAMHVIDLPEQLSVQHNLRDGIDPLKTQKHFIRGGK